MKNLLKAAFLVLGFAAIFGAFCGCEKTDYQHPAHRTGAR